MSFEEIKNLLGNWPVAVDPSLICAVDKEMDKIERASNIMTIFMNESLKDKKFLDFGCGEGHTIAIAQDKGAAVALGYDIVESGNLDWGQDLTTDFNQIQTAAPFDVILLYDVLDHIQNMEECLKTVKSLCYSSTKVYVLTHPWCSRHGGHLYQKFNYAFAHIIFSEAELASLDIEIPQISKVVNPISKYENLFKNCGFSIERKEVVNEPVEEQFFKQPLLQNRIVKAFKSLNSAFKEFPKFQMEQAFHEYVIKLK